MHPLHLPLHHQTTKTRTVLPLLLIRLVSLERGFRHPVLRYHQIPAHSLIIHRRHPIRDTGLTATSPIISIRADRKWPGSW
ncbi:MAG: hypothetical protein BGO39_14285 [Chloroflexi bacterium 54-19]|nr:MAG: hypothetical protein BGO39_14285 [Chloroflexi bacterium 54-19]